MVRVATNCVLCLSLYRGQVQIYIAFVSQPMRSVWFV